MKFSQLIAASIAASSATASLVPRDMASKLPARQDDTDTNGTSNTTSSTSSTETTSNTTSGTSNTETTSGTTSGTSSASSTETTSNSTSESTSESNTESTTDSATDSNTESTSESTSNSTSESATESASESMTHSTTESTSQSTTESTAAATNNAVPTACDIYRTPMSAEDAAKLDVLFGDHTGSTTYAEWLVNYLSGLVTEIDDVNKVALAGTGDAYISDFTSIDISGILDLASAAPLYTCYLSSMFANAVADPSALAKRAVPTAEEKAKLIVLFERRESAGRVFNYAQLLGDETDELVKEIEEVISASSTNPTGYTSLFSVLDIQRLLSIASEAPIYTQGLSAAFETAVQQLTASPNVTTTQGPSSYVTVETIITPHVIGTSTIYETSLHTVTICTRCEEERYATATTLVICEEVCLTKYSEAAKTVTVTSCETQANGAVHSSVVTTTICDEVCETSRASAYLAAVTKTVTIVPQTTLATRTTNAFVYQTRNGAIQKAVGYGAGLLGLIALIL